MEMGAAVLVNGTDQLLGIVDLANRRDGKAAEMGLYEERLRVAVGNAADSHIALKLLDVALKLCPEGRILDVVNRAGEPVRSIHCHTSALGPQMGMIVRAEKKIQHTACLRCYSENTAHAIITSVVSRPAFAGTG